MVVGILVCLMWFVGQSCFCEQGERSFVIDYKNDCFRKDNQTFRYISGGIHYFRVPRIYWEDRLLKAQALGLNTIQTYIAWNIHEQEQGIYNFEGENDILHFINLAQKCGLLVIVRPGPYIDAEWEFGGFPWWLAKNKSLIMRSTEDERYMNNVETWMNVLLHKLKPKLYKNGGPIIAFQVENEYGNYYACDHKYLTALKDIFQNNYGDDVVLFTTDGYTSEYLKCGTSPQIFSTIDFGTEITAENAFKKLRKYQANGPLVNSEYYTGWLDYWGHPHQTRDSRKVAKYFDHILAINASVNLYMLEGGTNFGFMNGVDIDKDNNFLVSPTSYDYDAPLSEAGDPTKKYFALRNVLKKYVKSMTPVPKATMKTAYGKIKMTPGLDLKSLISLLYPHGTPFNSTYPLTMENVHQGYGFLLYRTKIPKQYQNQLIDLFIEVVHDRSIIYVDNIRKGVFERGAVHTTVLVTGEKLEILVENQGRIAYGPKGSHYLPDSKGILGNVLIDNHILTNWSMYPIDDKKIFQLMDQSKEKFLLKSKNLENAPIVYCALFTLDHVTDTYIKMDTWSKGQIYINHFNLGRYWSDQGPQQTLYVPKNVLKLGNNRLMLLELDKAPCTFQKIYNCSVEFVAKPILG